VDRDDGVAAVVLAAEHLARLGGLDVRLEGVYAYRQLGVHRLARLGPFDQHAEVLGAPLQGVAERQLFLQPPAPLQQLLRLGGVLPEIGVGAAGVDPGQLRSMAWGVKDNSAGWTTVSRDPGTA
jgi:hypothetical protein